MLPILASTGRYVPGWSTPQIAPRLAILVIDQITSSILIETATVLILLWLSYGWPPLSRGRMDSTSTHRTISSRPLLADDLNWEIGRCGLVVCCLSVHKPAMCQVECESNARALRNCWDVILAFRVENGDA